METFVRFVQSVALLLLFFSSLNSRSPEQSSEQKEEPKPQTSDTQTSSVTSPKSDTIVLLNPAPPVYPADALRNGVQGRVWVKVVVSEKGKVESSEILSGDPALTPAALDLAKQWLFKPFIKNGKSI